MYMYVRRVVALCVCVVLTFKEKGRDSETCLTKTTYYMILLTIFSVSLLHVPI